MGGSATSQARAPGGRGEVAALGPRFPRWRVPLGRLRSAGGSFRSAAPMGGASGELGVLLLSGV